MSSSAGERVEVDYAGDPIEWFDSEDRRDPSARGCSSPCLASASSCTRARPRTCRARNWLGCHRRMFAFYTGVTHVLVPDCLKQGVLKCHLYDPDLNPAYAALGTFTSQLQ